MAKIDFCFTYYDGDATRETAHMNRLERGCYHDLIIAIRNFGHLTLNHCKKILGKDFDDCWPSVELVLKIDDDGKYYIEWLENSLIQSKKHSEKQKENRAGITKNKQNDNQINNLVPPNDNQNGVLVEPLKDGDGNEYGIKNENESQNLLIPKMLFEFKKFNPDYPVDEGKDYPALLLISKFLAKKNGLDFSLKKDFVEAVMPYWTHLCEKIPKDNFFKNYSISQVEKHIQAIILNVKNGKSISQNKCARQASNDAASGFAERAKSRFDAYVAAGAVNG